ncbi:TetR/AcrR family transcriptional regulator [Pelotomaculum terephthalicicum JT]|uniref:TetR/AcrR family transcriptional regulator n=1 Tax=Pelotomaculum terephthalicicum TaxID=206393 RepID=UPI0009CB7296|nr:TetR/AcrR family transcriptional regulator [Pelotomaculum terephthalicicum]MCG9969690.1 TetR/AcrR family transcriptional regulator [Pelotomaculum terephthalicicum JT]OPY59995.1 MAG: HTH-type transcriptional repressor KstR2 [Pelotomaculum sp. PtaU1.Bin065]
MEPGDMLVESRMERKKRETRQKIIKVAMDLFQKQGFYDTTMEQIAEVADIARKTLYNHFPVKEAIVDEYVRGVSKEFAQEIIDSVKNLPDTKARLLAALDKAYAWVEINPEITGICLGYRFKNMCHGSAYNEGETGTQRIMAEIIRYGQETGEIRRDISIKLLVLQLDILRGTVVMGWLGDKSKYKLRKEIAKIVDLFIYGAVDRQESQAKAGGAITEE